MSFWEESKSEYFNLILSKLFEDLLEYALSVLEWTEEEWREAIKEEMKTENFPKEIENFVWDEFQRFWEWKLNKYGTIEELEDEIEEETAKRKEEKLKIEQSKAQSRQEEQKALKESSLVLELIRQYEEAVEQLEKEKTPKNYTEALTISHYIMCDYQYLGCLDEFSQVPKYYKKIVHEYWDREKNIESLRYVIAYYTCEDLLAQMNNVEEKKQRIAEGIKYIKYFCKLHPGNEEYAQKYVECYINSYLWCRTKEDLEQQKYALKAYHLAKEFALKFKSEQMKDILGTAARILQIYYLNHNQPEKEELVEMDYQKIVKVLEGERMREIRMRNSE